MRHNLFPIRPMPTSQNSRADATIIVPSTIFILCISLFFILWPDQSGIYLKQVFNGITTYFGSVFLWCTLAFTLLAAYLACSRWGNIKFGEKDEKPAFSDFSWIAMMFCTGVAGAVMYWSIAEPLFNLINPPMEAEPFSPEAFKWAGTYVLFHWGPLTWSWYVVCALPICYMYYRRKSPVLRVSSACREVLGKRVDGWMGKTIDAFFCIGLVASNTAVMGVSIPIIAFSLSQTFGIEPSFSLQLGVLAISTVIFSSSVALGLEKGIARLSHINVIIALCLVVYTLTVGPTTFIIDNFTNSFGTLVSNYFRMSLWTAPHTSCRFPQDWTVFYALWMASYGPFMGLFIARISRGRTVRQIIVMGLLSGMLGAWLIHGVFGGYTLSQQSCEGIDAAAILQEQGPAMAVVSVLQSLPGGSIVLLAYCVFSTIFLATSVDSSAYTLSTVCTRHLPIGGNPAMWHRMLWAFLQALLPASMLFIGGFEPMKTWANIAGCLMLFAIIPMVLSFFKMIKDEDPIALKYPEISDKLKRLEQLEREIENKKRAD